MKCPKCGGSNVEVGSGIGDVTYTFDCPDCGYWIRNVIVGWGPRSCEYGRRPIIETKEGITASRVVVNSDVRQRGAA